MPKMNLVMVPPCAQSGHPLSPCHPSVMTTGTGLQWRGMAESLQKVLMEILAGEAYRRGLSCHLQRDVGLPEDCPEN